MYAMSFAVGGGKIILNKFKSELSV